MPHMPFHFFQPSERIVLYGSGHFGQEYYRYFYNMDYRKIVLRLDKNFDGKTVFAPETIKDLPDDMYDVVLITVTDSTVADEIKTMLIGYGVPEAKILNFPPVPSDFFITYHCSALSLEQFLNDDKAVSGALSDYFIKSFGNILFFHNFIEEINNKRSSGLYAKICRRAAYITENVLTEPELCIVLLSVLYEARCFEADLFRLFIKYIGEIKGNTAQKYWLLQDSNYMWLFYPDIIYDGFFSDRQRLMADYAKELALTWVPPKYNRDDNKKICVISHNLDECVAQLLSPIVSELKRLGYSLYIIDLDPSYGDSGTSFLKSKWCSISQNDALKNKLKNDYYPTVELIFFPSASTSRTRQQQILGLICEINPYCILDATDEFSIISYYYHCNYPTVYLPLRIQGCSSSFFHKMALTATTIEDVSISPPVRHEHVFFLPLYKAFLPPKKQFKREDYGLSQDDIIVVTVGNRLSFELSEELILRFCGLIETANNIKWLCVGCNDLPHMAKKHECLVNKNVFFIEYEDDLPGLYGICDMYVNPMRVGGGTTIAWAMQQGLAIVSPLGADAGEVLLGKANSLKNENDIVPYIEKLAKDRGLLENIKARSKEIVSGWNLQAHIGALVKVMDELAENINIGIADDKL